MIRITNMNKAISQARREFLDLSPANFTKAVNRAINHTLNKSRTKAARGMAKIYKLKYGEARDGLRKRNAYGQNMTGRLDSVAPHKPIMQFTEAQYDAGVIVNIKGQYKRLAGAFMAQVGSGRHVGIFARGVYSDNAFQFRHRRITPSKKNDNPIVELHTIANPQAFMNPQVIEPTADKSAVDFINRLPHELKRISESQ